MVICIEQFQSDHIFLIGNYPALVRSEICVEHDIVGFINGRNGISDEYKDGTRVLRQEVERMRDDEFMVTLSEL